MRDRRIPIIMAAILFLAAVMPALASGEKVTVKGEILDLACYVAHEQHGDDHAKCAVRCVKGGQPMGLLAEDGTVYVLFADHADMAPYEAAKDKAGKTVEVAGTVSDKGGVKGLTVAEVKGS